MSDDDEYYYYSEDDEVEGNMDPPSGDIAVTEVGDAVGNVDNTSNNDNNTSSSISARRPSVGIGKRCNANDEYSVLTLEDLEADQDELVSQVAELASLSKDRASILLLKFNWNKEKLLEKYFQNPEKTCTDAGAVQGTVDKLSAQSNSSNETKNVDEPMFMCNIIFEEVPMSQTFSMGCTTEDHPEDHRFSVEAWQDYLSCKTDDGPECVFARCPMDGCQCGVSPTVWEAILSQPAHGTDGNSIADDNKKYAESLQLYRRFLSESYVNINRNIKWCPSAGCSAALKASGAVTHVVCSQCSQHFCFKCGLEPHGPMRCALLSVWLDKCNNESETANWILANTKKCPMCATRIEKDSGCNHMTCRMCKHDFCWVCEGPWKEHGTSSGGYYSCNKYTGDAEEKDGAASKTVDGKTKAKRELDRYLFYYQRFATHEQAGKFAAKQRQQALRRMIELQTTGNVGWIDVQYLQQGVEQLIDCRRVLKYTYAFAYYMPAGSKKDLFEYNQSMLESHTERLSELVELADPDVERSEVINFTRVTCKFMNSLLDQVESDGLADLIVETIAAATTAKKEEARLAALEQKSAGKRGDSTRGSKARSARGGARGGNGRGGSTESSVGPSSRSRTRTVSGASAASSSSVSRLSRAGSTGSTGSASRRR